MRVAECDVCGHQVDTGDGEPAKLPAKECRSTLWNKGGVDGQDTGGADQGGAQPKDVGEEESMMRVFFAQGSETVLRRRGYKA